MAASAAELAPAAGGIVEVATAQVGTLAGCQVGVMGITDGPPRAKVVVAGRSAGVPWEAVQVVAPGAEVMAGPARFVVEAVSPSGGGGGRVRFAPAGRGPWPESAVLLAGDGTLRLDGPELDTATNVAITGRQAGAVQVEWWPARLPRQYAEGADLHTASLHAGERVTLGRSEARVLSVQDAAPGRAVLELLGHPTP